MARRRSSHPTELELMILQIIWQSGPSTVRQVSDALWQSRKLAFTSVLTTMNIMVTKGYLEARRRPRKQGGTIYRAKVAQGSTALTMLESLAQRLFGGSLATAISRLLSEGELNKKDVEELRAVVNQRRRDEQS